MCTNWLEVGGQAQGCPDPLPRPSCTGSLVGQRLSDPPGRAEDRVLGSTRSRLKHHEKVGGGEGRGAQGLAGRVGLHDLLLEVQPEGREGLEGVGVPREQACAGAVGEGRRCGPHRDPPAQILSCSSSIAGAALSPHVRVPGPGPCPMSVSRVPCPCPVSPCLHHPCPQPISLSLSSALSNVEEGLPGAGWEFAPHLCRP